MNVLSDNKSRSKIVIISVVVIMAVVIWTVMGKTCINMLNNKESANKGPEISQITSICELATMEYFFHNVAKYNEKDASGIWIFKKDKDFWIEYSGVVKVGIDTTNLSINIDRNKVTITLPPAKVLSSKIDEASLTKDSFYVAKDSAEIEAEDEIKAFKQAQEDMVQAVKEDTILLTNALERVEKLLKDYINNIGELAGVVYDIEFVYL